MPGFTAGASTIQPAACHGTSEPRGSSASSITTLSKASASRMPSQTAWRSAGTSPAWASRAETSSTCSSMRWCWAAEATS